MQTILQLTLYIPLGTATYQNRPHPCYPGKVTDCEASQSTCAVPDIIYHVGIFPVTPQESTIFKTIFRITILLLCVQTSLPSDSPSAQHEAHVACSEDQP
jgi:hypothetical protein